MRISDLPRFASLELDLKLKACSYSMWLENGFFLYVIKHQQLCYCLVKKKCSAILHMQSYIIILLKSKLLGQKTELVGRKERGAGKEQLNVCLPHCGSILNTEESQEVITGRSASFHLWFLPVSAILLWVLVLFLSDINDKHYYRR